MRHLTATLCLTVAVLLGSAGMSSSTEPVKDFCLAGTKHSHSPVSGQCSDAYESGNYTTALREWEPLAKNGNSSSQFNLGQMYRRGQGVPENDKTAVKWFTLAAEQGNASAQTNQGVMYDEGQGVVQDYVRAHMWYNIAASSGKSENASENRDIVAKLMTPSQIETAQRLAQECEKKIYKGC